jgi:hypothetical protein
MPPPSLLHTTFASSARQNASREEENSRIDADNSLMRDVLDRIKSEVERSNRLLSRLRGEPHD